MKITKTSSGNKIKISKSEWESIGKKQGWMKKIKEAITRDEFDAMPRPEDKPVRNIYWATLEDGRIALIRKGRQRFPSIAHEQEKTRDAIAQDTEGLYIQVSPDELKQVGRDNGQEQKEQKEQTATVSDIKTIKTASVDVRCPNCRDNLGKDTENPKETFCSNCGVTIHNPRGYDISEDQGCPSCKK